MKGSAHSRVLCREAAPLGCVDTCRRMWRGVGGVVVGGLDGWLWISVRNECEIEKYWSLCTRTRCGC
jgi:hypothetical protein